MITAPEWAYAPSRYFPKHFTLIEAAWTRVAEKIRENRERKEEGAAEYAELRRALGIRPGRPRGT